MPETSPAAVMVANRKLEMQDFPIPEIGSDDALLQVECVGVCGSDWGFYQGEGERIGARFPFILGHENIGIIHKVGRQASQRWKLREGDRVAVEEPIPCGRCRYCLGGRYLRCDENRRYGSHIPTSVPPRLWGGCSHYMYLHPNSMIYKVSAGVSASEASFYLPLANGIRWVQQIAGAGSGDTVVIQGPGQQGLGCVIGAKEAGVSCIIVSGLKKDSRRLEAARALGADFTVCVEEEDLISRVTEITDGRMADLVVDVSHHATEPVVMALQLVKKCSGRIILAGAKHRTVPNFPADEILYREITITGVRGHDFRSIEPALRIIASRKYPLQLLGTHQFRLQETEEAVLTVGGEGRPEAIHVTVLPWA